MYKSGQIIHIYGDGFREFDDRPPTTKAAWGLNIFWSKIILLLVIIYSEIDSYSIWWHK